MIDQQTILDNKEKDKIVQICSVDNLDLGCALIKKAVREKAVEDSNNDTVIQENIQKRKQAREQGIKWENNVVSQ